MTIQTVDPRALRDAFGAFPTGVTVVTACDGDGHPIGFTANSFTSVSLNPPLLLVCLAKTSRNFAIMTGAQHLRSTCFGNAKRRVEHLCSAGRGQICGGRMGEGIGRLPDILERCGLVRMRHGRGHRGGDHVILMGRIEAFDNSAATVSAMRVAVISRRARKQGSVRGKRR
ncbi:hypothetical protein BMW22_37540 (plasmid) [Rhizobium leguminosarum]|uniref:Flavin reductase like domain-containing protein n=1 Tax=Rhizobium leguminosarum TaxID=384 RepID=A0A1L3ZNB2_RHILE|nr:flavin reductase family protein [Rhizobium leguminosarum]API57108.1 hypothetical protein BMW22_37540 [Rhizobium leguminosarum]